MRFEADMAGIPVVRSETAELSAMGAAYLAGVGAGLWDMDDLQAMRGEETVFVPAMDRSSRQDLRAGWRNMVARSRGHAVGEAIPGP